ncbi:MAG: hypothetical protein Q9169_002678 [Polycauliona sp. 2 TL-2023]
MNQDMPFEEYMPGGSPHSGSPTLQENSPSPSETFTLKRDSGYQHYFDTVSSCPDSPTSSPSASDPHHPSQEMSPLEQEVLHLYKMARLDDGPDLESECGDDYGGGVSLAGHDIMDVDDSAIDCDPPNVNSRQSSMAASGIAPLTVAPTGSLSQAFAQAWEQHLDSSHESLNGIDASQVATTNSTDGLNHQTSEPNTQIPMTQASNANHEISSIHPEPSHGSALDLFQDSDLFFGVDAHLDYQTPFPHQESPVNFNQLVPNAYSTANDGFFHGTNTDMMQSFGQSSAQTYNLPLDIQDLNPQDYEEQKNFSLVDCLDYCAEGHEAQHEYRQSIKAIGEFPRITIRDIEQGKQNRKEGIVAAEDVESGKYDSQGINWQAFGIPRGAIRGMRRKTYVNHVRKENLGRYTENRIFRGWPMYQSAQYLKLDAREKAKPIANTEKYFQFSRMDLQHQISIPHFQLRHTISASTKNAIFFPTVTKDEYCQKTTGSQITNFNPDVDNDSYTIDTANIDRNLDNPEMNKIYTLSAKNDILVAGGHGGEYAYKPLSSNPSDPFASGMITHSENSSSTNHVHTYLSRSSGLPQAVFSSNDSHIHTLDLTTNKFISRHNHEGLVNCSATSPDTRLRVLVRDDIHPLLVEADTGIKIAELDGHEDFGFACDWAADGRYFATGAQDGLVQIFDMRNWRAPIQTLLTEIGGVRALAFSPASSTNKPVLLMAESADFVHVVDASDGMFSRKQTIDFFGEVSGVTFEEEGGRFWVGVADPEFGGVMEFERSGRRGRGRRRRRKSWEDEEWEDWEEWRRGRLQDIGVEEKEKEKEKGEGKKRRRRKWVPME